MVIVESEDEEEDVEVVEVEEEIEETVVVTKKIQKRTNSITKSTKKTKTTTKSKKKIVEVDEEMLDLGNDSEVAEELSELEESEIEDDLPRVKEDGKKPKAATRKGVTITAAMKGNWKAKSRVRSHSFSKDFY